MFKNRSAVEIMVISFTMLLCFVVLIIATGVVIIKIKSPTTDISTAVASLTSIMAAILAALLGLVAGKSDSLTTVLRRPDDEPLREDEAA